MQNAPLLSVAGVTKMNVRGEETTTTTTTTAGVIAFPCLFPSQGVKWEETDQGLDNSAWDSSEILTLLSCDSNGAHIRILSFILADILQW